jgi:hypothetical protein
MANHTPRRAARVPDSLMDAARRGLGLPADARESDVMRRALALAGGVDVADHTPTKTGRPAAPKRPRTRAAAA